MNTQTELLKEALDYLKDNQHHIADNERHAYVMMYNGFVERIEKHLALEAMADNERELGLGYDKNPPWMATHPDQLPPAPPVPWSQELESVWAEPDERPAPAQEPVAWTLTETLYKRETTTRGHLWFSDPQNCMWTPLYTTPPAPAQPLTVARIEEIAARTLFPVDFARAIEAAHGITKGGE